MSGRTARSGCATVKPRLLRGLVGAFVEDAFGEFVDGGAGVAASVDGVSDDAGKDKLRFLTVFVGDGDLHGGLAELLGNRRRRIIVDLVGLILPKLGDEIGAGRRRSVFIALIGRLLQDEPAARAFYTYKAAVQIAYLGAR